MNSNPCDLSGTSTFKSWREDFPGGPITMWSGDKPFAFTAAAGESEAARAGTLNLSRLPKACRVDINTAGNGRRIVTVSSVTEAAKAALVELGLSDPFTATIERDQGGDILELARSSKRQP